MGSGRTLEEIREELWNIGDNLSRVLDTPISRQEAVTTLDRYTTVLEELKKELQE